MVAPAVADSKKLPTAPFAPTTRTASFCPLVTVTVTQLVATTGVQSSFSPSRVPPNVFALPASAYTLSTVLKSLLAVEKVMVPAAVAVTLYHTVPWALSPDPSAGSTG